MKVYDCVTFSVLLDIVKHTSKKTGLTPPTRSEISNMYYESKQVPLPVVCRRKDGMMWVDKYYVAYQFADEDVHYTYLTPHHMNEETASYKVASKLRGQDLRLPDDIQRAFQKAERYMMDTHENIWVEEFVNNM